MSVLVSLWGVPPSLDGTRRARIEVMIASPDRCAAQRRTLKASGWRALVTMAPGHDPDLPLIDPGDAVWVLTATDEIPGTVEAREMVEVCVGPRLPFLTVRCDDGRRVWVAITQVWLR